MSDLVQMPRYPEIAFRELMLGVSEISGPFHNLRILEYFTATGLKPSRGDETAWCAAGLNWCLRVDGVTGTNAANARSFLKWGVEIDKPRRGAIAVLWRESRESWKGHVAILVGWNTNNVDLLGGNQGNTWSIRRYPRSRLLSLRWGTVDLRFT